MARGILRKEIQQIDMDRDVLKKESQQIDMARDILKTKNFAAMRQTMRSQLNPSVSQNPGGHPYKVNRRGFWQGALWFCAISC